MVPRGCSGQALVASVGVRVRVCVRVGLGVGVGGASDGVCVGLAAGRTGGLRGECGSGSACVGAASWWPLVDASGGVWGCGPGSPPGPEPGLFCGRMVLKGCSGRALVVAVFVQLGTLRLPVSGGWCCRVAVAAWCCGVGGCCCAARLAARSCWGLCCLPVPDGARAPVVLVASMACGRWIVWGVEVDGLDEVEVFGLLGALVPDGAGARALVALVAAVVRGRGWVVMVATLWVEVEELWCRAPPAVIWATTALPYAPACIGGTSGWRALTRH